MQPVITEKLVEVAQKARAARHGEKEAIYQAACQELGISRATLLSKIKQLSVAKPRKRRADAGQSNLNRDEAMIISAALMESTRKNGKRLYSVEDAVDMLRSNGKILAGSIDEHGEFTPLSVSAIVRAMRSYGVHPDQLNAPAPAQQLASLHPNHVWQIDASLCVLYYLKNGQKTGSRAGLQVMRHDVFYKNKPKNLAKISQDRVWSYEITDHATGWIYVEYVMGAESSENLCNTLINAMQERTTPGDILHGVPKILYMDPGSAPKATMTANLCQALGIEVLIHAPGQARATGSVEKARDIIERSFEPGLAFTAVNSLEELNAKAAKWRGYFNSQKIHSRYGRPRNEMWMHITQEQLIKAPSVEICRQLAVSAPVARRVTDKLRVDFRRSEYDVSTVPGVLVGDKLLITRSPWSENEAQAVIVGEDGHRVYHVIKEVEKNELGFAVDAPVIGQSFKQHRETAAQNTAKEIELLVTGTDSEDAAKAVRKAKQLPFGGQLDPYKPMDDAVIPVYLPRRGQESQILAARVEIPPLSHIEAAKKLISLFQSRGIEWEPLHYQLLTKHYPDGVQETELNNVADTLLSSNNAPSLRLVNN